MNFYAGDSLKLAANKNLHQPFDFLALLFTVLDYFLNLLLLL